MLKIGVIGSGTRAAWVVRCMSLADSEVRLSVVADPNPQLARKRLDEAGVDHTAAHFVMNVNELLTYANELDGVVVGTRCNLHAPIAIALAESQLPIFLEKPVATSVAQLAALQQAYAGREQAVVVSFPLRFTPLFHQVRDIVASGRLGTINQVQAANYVPYGGVYFTDWYRDYESNGGLWLQKATHDIDCINQLIEAPPQAVVAMSTRKIYGGEMPDDLTCSNCEQAQHCPESPTSIAARDDDGGMGREDHACAFSSSIRHHDAGSAMILYADGTHAAYSQNFISRRSAAAHGARVTGYLASLTFDLYTCEIQIIEHHGKAIETLKVPLGDDHHGGDANLARNFIDVMRQIDTSKSDLSAGILSAAVCLAARSSESTRRIEPVIIPGKSEPEPRSASPRVTAMITTAARSPTVGMSQATD